jgi:hypothetical protein
MRIEGFRVLGDDVMETVINKSEKVKALKKKGDELTPAEKKELTEEEKEYKSKRKQIQEKLIKFATRIPAFMYLTDFRENTLQDVITKLEPDLFATVAGLSVDDFDLLVRLKVFNTEHMNQAVFAFRRDLRRSGCTTRWSPATPRSVICDRASRREVRNDAFAARRRGRMRRSGALY